MRILLASSLLFLFSFQSVKAESVWLILQTYGFHSAGLSNSLLKIEMKDMNQCEEQGKDFMDSPRIDSTEEKKRYKYRGFECLKGK